MWTSVTAPQHALDHENKSCDDSNLYTHGLTAQPPRDE